MSGRASGYVKGLIVCPNGELLSRTEKLVALVLADSHQDKGRGTFPSEKTMAEEALMDERQCRRVLDSLERKGVILRKRPAKQGRGQMTYYFFPELDQKTLDQKGGSQTPLFNTGKEGTHALLFNAGTGAASAGKRGAEGGQKGDKSGTPPIEEREQEQKQIPPPCPPLHGGSDQPSQRRGHVAADPGGKWSVISGQRNRDTAETLDEATERVMLAFGLSRRRDRRRLRAEIDGLARGEKSPGIVASAMIAERRKTPEQRRAEEQAWHDEQNERDGYRAWRGMSQAYRDQNPWGGRVFEEREEDSGQCSVASG